MTIGDDLLKERGRLFSAIESHCSHGEALAIGSIKKSLIERCLIEWCLIERRECRDGIEL